MVEIIGDVVWPYELRLPNRAGTTALSGAGITIFSGSKIWFHTGIKWEIVTSS